MSKYSKITYPWKNCMPSNPSSSTMGTTASSSLSSVCGGAVARDVAGYFFGCPWSGSGFERDSPLSSKTIPFFFLCFFDPESSDSLGSNGFTAGGDDFGLDGTGFKSGGGGANGSLNGS